MDDTNNDDSDSLVEEDTQSTSFQKQYALESTRAAQFRDDIGGVSAPNGFLKIKFMSNMKIMSVMYMKGLIAALLPCLAIYGWSFTMRQANHAVGASSRELKGSQERLFSDIEALTNAVFPINSTTLKLSRALNSSIGGDLSSFSSIETEVGDKLFSVLSTLPYLSQISYIGENGLLLSYYIKGNQTHALFANRTVSSNNSSLLPWYTQPVNDAGTRHGNKTNYLRQDIVNSTWFYDALNRKNGYASLGSGWAKDQEPFVLFAAPVIAQGQRGVLSLGVAMKALISFITRIDIHGGYLYLAVEDGVTVAENRIPNTRLAVHNGTVSIQITESDNRTDVGSPVTVSCKLDPLGPDDEASSVLDVKIHGDRYITHCARGKIVGLQAVFVLAFPHNQLAGFVQRQNKITLLVLVLFLAYMFAVVVFFVCWLHGIWNKVVVLRAALIKQNEATQQSERKSMNKSYAFASASHDVRTALAAIIGLIDLSRNRVPSDPEMEANLSQMNTCALNLLGILNTVLDTSKIEAGKMQLDEEEFDMAKVLEEIADMFYVVGNRKGLEIIWDHCDGSVMNLPLVKGDCGRFKQILSNLLSNAVKFTTEGHVVIRAWARKPRAQKQYINSKHEYWFLKYFPHLPWLTHKNKDTEKEVISLHKVQENPNRVEIVFEVDDSGKGIPKEKQKSVFENFVQVKEETIGTHEGTGLGLGIVQSLVRLMDGEIGIANKDPGEKGTCFRFNICLTTSEQLRPTFSRVVNTELSNYPGTPLSVRSGDSARSPKTEVIHAVVMITGDEARKISRRWMERQGMKVWPISRVSHLKAMLEKLKHNLPMSDVASGTLTRSDSSNSFSSTSHIREEVENVLSGKDDPIYSPSFTGRDRYKGGGTNSNPLLLIVIDMSFGPFMEICSVLNSFIKNVAPSRYKVAWLANPDTSGVHVNFLKSKQAPCDSILQKPFHGSRLISILKLLHEPTKASSVEEGSSQVAETIKGVEAKKETKENPLHGTNILVVEDNDLLLKLTLTMLSRFGASYECARNGEEAVNLVRKALTETKGEDGSSRSFAYNVVLMDCEMPVMDGFTATRVIREEEKWYGRQIPIVALTAHASSEKVEKCFEAGMDGHLVKPLKRDKLLEAVLPFVTDPK
ncbi:histidine kinase CKI1 [Aristolochia californica]|uniref:histidine kinase CKI1 n=1 Tax=Aristolochia californica TaxID=171875 RepID=UPI0035DFE805